MARIDECTIKRKNVDNDILWLDTDVSFVEPVMFELKYLDVDNERSPRTWTQVVLCEQINAIVKDNCLGIDLCTLKYKNNVAGIEIRIIVQGEKYNLKDDSDIPEIGIFSFSTSRNTFFISLVPTINDEANSTITLSEGTETDKLIIKSLPISEEFIPKLFCIGKRYCTDSNQGPIIRKDIVRHGDEWIILLNKNKYWSYSHEDCTLDCFIDYRHNKYDYSVVVPLKVENFSNYEIKTSDCVRKWYRTIQGTLACYVRTTFENANESEQTKNDSYNRVKVATWGSCYTRNMFQNFYNDNWRSIIDVCDSYFWFSAISSTSNKCDEHVFKIFKDKASEKNIQNVNREVYKKTFDYLKDSKAEYLLIDFYADAVAGVRRIDDNCYIGQGVALSPDMQLSDLYEEIVQCNYEKVDYRNAEYWDLWTHHCKILDERLKKLGYSKNVILIEGSFITKFKDSNNQITDYREIDSLCEKIDLNNLRAREALWHKMNEFYKSLNPNCKVLSMENYNYLGDKENKILGPNHYEHNYYKSEFAELCKLILLNKIS